MALQELDLSFTQDEGVVLGLSFESEKSLDSRLQAVP